MELQTSPMDNHQVTKEMEVDPYGKIATCAQERNRSKMNGE